MKDPNKEIQVKKLHVAVEELNLIIDNYNTKHAEICNMIDEIGRNGMQTSGYNGQGKINHISICRITETVTY